MAIRDFAERVVLVTGAASGIGRETALAFARTGAKLVVCDLNEPGIETTAQAIRDLGRPVQRVTLGHGSLVATRRLRRPACAASRASGRPGPRQHESPVGRPKTEALQPLTLR